jgi:predicted secreted Zn-dependent protease
MKSTIFLIMLFISLTGFNTDGDQNKLVWSDHGQLTWEDFKGQPKQNSFGDALTAVNISAKPYVKNRKLNYAVKAYFLKDKSWCKVRSGNLLEHEQLHFDIAELYARKVRKKVAELQRTGIRDHRVYNNAIEQILAESNELDQRYDRQTLNGSLPNKQFVWELEIKIQMNELQAFQ